MEKANRYYFVTGLICLFGLIFLALIFYKERVIFSDSAFSLVYLLIEQRVYEMPLRMGASIPQFIPLSAILLHCSLKVVMLLQSISTQLLYLMVYMLAYRFSKKRVLFLLIPLNLVLLVNEVFFWPISEVQQGLIWLCLYAVILFEKIWDGQPLWKSLCLHILFIAWIQFLHPLLFFPIVFLIVYFYEFDSQLFSRKFLYHLTICIAVFGVRYMLGSNNWYESGKFDLMPALTNHLPHFFQLGSVVAFTQKLSSAYLIYIVLLSVSVMWLLINKQFLRCLILLIFSAGYWILIMISSADDARFYTENMLLPLGFLVSIPIVAEILPALKWKYMPIVFLILMIIRLAYIYHSHTDYTDRFRIYAPYFSYLHQHKLNGVIVDDKLIDQKKAIVTWSSGYESILLSGLRSADSCMIVQIDGDTAHYGKHINSDTSLVTIYEVWGNSQLPQQYIKLRGGRYQILTKQP